MTGVQVIDGAPKAMEWLLTLAPGTQTVYVPYHPDDRVAMAIVKSLPDAAARLGVALVLDKVYTPEAGVAAIATLPKAAAILLILRRQHAPGVMKARLTWHSYWRLVIPREDVLFTYGTTRLTKENGHPAGRAGSQRKKQAISGAGAISCGLT
jgi:hypothetical protein